MKTLKRILGVLLIFAFGVFVGAVVSNAGVMKKLRGTLLGGPEAVMEVIVQRLDRELKFDPEQKRKVQTIMDDTQIRLRQLRQQIKPEQEEAMRSAETRTRAILYPEQVSKFDKLISRGRQQKNLNGPTTSPPPPSTPASATPVPDPAPQN